MKGESERRGREGEREERSPKGGRGSRRAKIGGYWVGLRKRGGRVKEVSERVEKEGKRKGCRWVGLRRRRV